MSLVHGGADPRADQSLAIHSLENKNNPSSIDASFGLNRILYDSFHPLSNLFSNFIAALGRPSRSNTAGVIIIGRNGVGKSSLLRYIAMRNVPIPVHVFISIVDQEVQYIFPLFWVVGFVFFAGLIYCHPSLTCHPKP